MNYIYIRPDLKTIGDFHRFKVGRRGGSPNDWTLIYDNVEMQLRPRKPSGNARPESEFDDIVAHESQWYWVRLSKPLLNMRLGDRLTRTKIGSRVITSSDQESEGLFIIQSDPVGPVHQLLLRESDRSV